jgi:hypothetical protein
MKTIFALRYSVILVLGLALPAAAPAAPPAAIAAESVFLPDLCQLVGVVRVEQLLGSAAYKQLRTAAQVEKDEKAIADNLPLPLDQIDQLVLGGVVTGSGEGIFVIRARTKIKPEQVKWATSRFDAPVVVKVGKYDMYRRRSESYCIVDNLLVFGKESALRKVLERTEATYFTKALAAELANADMTATACFVLDVADIRTRRQREVLPFIPGLHMVSLEDATDVLTLTAKVGDTIELSASALAAVPRDPVADLPKVVKQHMDLLKSEVSQFTTFHQKTLEIKSAPPAVLDIFKFMPVVQDKRVSVSTRFGGDAGAKLLYLLAK